MAESAYTETVSKLSGLSNAELDQELEEAAIMNEKSEMLLCCYLSEMQDRGAFRDFGYSSIGDYAQARFGFGERKTRYLVALGHKIERLPKIREALATGKIGWCKASRVASVATREDEVMWLDSALSLTVQQLEQRIKDGTDSLAGVLHLPLTEERRVMWENALEIYRRRAGAEISPVQAFELMVAEVIAEWGYCGVEESEAPETTEIEDETSSEPSAETELETEPENAPETDDDASEPGLPPKDDATKEKPVFPGAEAIETSRIEESLWANEGEAEHEFHARSEYSAIRQQVLERDGWKCTYPLCGARAQLHVHHIRYRSRGGCDEPWNLCVVCDFHHKLIHSSQVLVKGRAPAWLEWTPPKLMREVLERRRNNPSFWSNDLEVREWSLESRAAPASAVT